MVKRGLHATLWPALVWIAATGLGFQLAEARLARVSADAPPPAIHSKKQGFIPTKDYVSRSIQGWTVLVNRSLLTDKADLGKKALDLLDRKLAEVCHTLPARACAQLQKVPIWLGEDDGHAPCSEYHPSSEWLRENGYNPDKAKCVEIGNASRFLEWSVDQPSMVLHELAHAYHDRFLGFQHSGVEAAYRRALAGGRYDQVRRIGGKVERAYALTVVHEYFAEGTEAYFGRNDFYPFDRQELEKHDPELFRLLAKLWGE